VEEAVSIGTTYLRASTLPEPYHKHSQDLFRQYVNTRLDLDKVALDAPGFTEASDRSKQIQYELWADAAAVTQSDRSAITAAYINALNETIDLHEKRVAAFENRIPPSIWLLIASVSAIAGVHGRGNAHVSLLVDLDPRPSYDCDCRRFDRGSGCPEQRFNSPRPACHAATSDRVAGGISAIILAGLFFAAIQPCGREQLQASANAT
jgi:hypothetical protein